MIVADWGRHDWLLVTVPPTTRTPYVPGWMGMPLELLEWLSPDLAVEVARYGVIVVVDNDGCARELTVDDNNYVHILKVTGAEA